jgi:hypothetical protein
MMTPERGRDGLRAAIEALLDPLGQYRPYAVQIDGDVILAVDVDTLRRILAEHPATAAGGAEALAKHVWRGLAETLVKNTRWSEWKRNGLRWQHERITELAEALERWMPESDAFKRLLAAHDAKARADERERIAQAIQRAKPPHLTRDYTPVDAAYDTAARIARGES